MYHAGEGRRIESFVATSATTVVNYSLSPVLISDLICVAKIAEELLRMRQRSSGSGPCKLGDIYPAVTTAVDSRCTQT